LFGANNPTDIGQPDPLFITGAGWHGILYFFGRPQHCRVRAVATAEGK